MIESFGIYLAGIGIFFIGLQTVSRSMKQASAGRFGSYISSRSKNRWLASLWGFLSGAITQHAAGSTFMVAGMISAGLLTVSAAFPVIVWANIGTSVLVLLAAVNFKTAVYYLIGIAGIMLSFKGRNAKASMLLTVIYGTGLLFLGLYMLKSGAEPVIRLDLFKTYTTLSARSLVLAFLFGIILRIVIQSSSAAAIMAIALTMPGVFSQEQSMMVLYGINIGVAGTTWLLSTGLKGAPRQISMYLVILNVFSSALFIVLFVMEDLTGLPMITWLINHLSHTVAGQLGILYFLNKLIPGLVLLFFDGWMAKFLASRYPADEEEELSRLRFLFPEAADSPAMSAALIRMEQGRIIAGFTRYLGLPGNNPEQEKRIDPNALYQAISGLNQQIDQFIALLCKKEIHPAGLESLIVLKNRQSLASGINDHLKQVSMSFEYLTGHGALKGMFDAIREGLATILLTFADVVEKQDSQDRELLVRMTADKGELMQRMRKNAMSAHRLTDDEKTILLNTTLSFEKIVWLIAAYL